MDDHQEVGRSFFSGDAEALHFLRQTRERLRNAVLHLDLRFVEIGVESERDREGHHAVGGGLRKHVQHAFDAVDLLSSGEATVSAMTVGFAPG